MSEAHLKTVAAGIHAWIGAGGDSNAGAIETPHGLIVVDAQQNRPLAERFRGALADLGLPIRAVVNTHFHLDHVAGNAVFADVPIIAHEKTRHALARELADLNAGSGTVTDPVSKARMFFGGNFAELVPDAERGWFYDRIGREAPIRILPPSETFADRMDFTLPSDVVHMTYRGPAHCDGDVVIHLERGGVVFLGDLFFNGRFPWFGDCDLSGWIATLDRVLTMDVQTVIPGHGEPATLKEVAAFRDLLAAVRAAVERARKLGLSEDAAVHDIVLADYAAMSRYREWMPFNIRSAYRYLGGA